MLSRIPAHSIARLAELLSPQLEASPRLTDPRATQAEIERDRALAEARHQKQIRRFAGYGLRED